jgi:hypothetical protein
VLFRDTAHGLATWAFATLLGIGVLGGASTWVTGNILGGASQGATQEAAQAAPTDYFVDTLLRPAINVAPSGSAAQNQQDATSARREVGLIFARDFATGSEFPSADRAYLVQLVASRNGMSQQDAQARVNEVLTKTKEYLDAARKNAIAVAMWLTLALFAGAFAASAAAIEGGQLRDGKWRGVIFHRSSEVRSSS